jgi:hypothetical protein
MWSKVKTSAPIVIGKIAFPSSSDRDLEQLRGAEAVVKRLSLSVAATPPRSTMPTSSTCCRLCNFQSGCLIPKILLAFCEIRP